MKDDSVYLRHIQECIRRIQEDVAGGREEFFSSHTVQDAVLRNLHTMSESTQRLSDSLKAKHPEVEWRRIAAFRNVLVHDYLGIDLERVWDIVQQDAPALGRTVAAMLQETQ
ncbi:MAG: DUF86 domain-containing protein [Acidobacteria bacterium]|nr:DUF86 domain-containing protein [Acidobacteriota bacterium]